MAEAAVARLVRAAASRGRRRAASANASAAPCMADRRARAEATRFVSSSRSGAVARR